MNSKELQLVTFEQAKRLKKAGFDWECLRYYFTHYNNPDIGYIDEDVDRYEYNWNSPDTSDLSMRLYEDSDGLEGMNIYSAPTVAIALKWFRDVKDIPYSVRFQPNCKYGWEYYHSRLWKFSMEDYDDQEAAESALLDELLTLIKNNK